MTLIRILIFVAALALVASIFWAMGADGRSLGAVLGEMISKPWTVVTLIDLYLGFILCAVVIALFERSWAARLFWAAPVFLLGNFWAAAWFVFRLPEIARRFANA